MFGTTAPMDGNYPHSEDEEELNEHGAKGQDPGHECGQREAQLPRRLGNVTGDLVGAHGVLIGLEAGAHATDAIYNNN